MDVYVNCNCYRDGLAEDHGLESKVAIDDCGEVGLLPVSEVSGYFKKYRQSKFYNRYLYWKEHACDHKWMFYESSKIDANQVNYFRMMLRTSGIGKYRCTVTELPESGQHQISPKSAQKILEELSFIEVDSALKGSLHLIDVETGKIIFQSAAKKMGVIMSNNGRFELGINTNGFFIKNKGQFIFESKEFIQIVAGNKNVPPARAPVVFADRPSGDRIQVLGGISDEVIELDKKPKFANNNIRYPKHFIIEEHPSDLSLILSVKRKLEDLCQAAVLTGNPILWR